MKRRILGGTGISVSEYALGTMMFGALANKDHDESVRIIHRALDAGINFVDTADIYSAGESEEIVGKALKGRRDDVVLATKAHGSMGPDANHSGTSRRWLVREVENSLRRLGTDHIDLYQMHRPDPDTDIDETLAALTDLVRAGKVLAVGSSTFPAEQIVEAQWVSERRGHVRFRTEQPPYSILARGVEAAVLPTTQKYGMGVLTWGPLSAGWLSGRYTQAADVEQRGDGRRARSSTSSTSRCRTTLANSRPSASCRNSRPRPACSLPHLAIGVRAGPPRRHVGDHRPSHDGAARRPARRDRARR